MSRHDGGELEMGCSISRELRIFAQISEIRDYRVLFENTVQVNDLSLAGKNTKITIRLCEGPRINPLHFRPRAVSKSPANVLSGKTSGRCWDKKSRSFSHVGAPISSQCFIQKSLVILVEINFSAPIPLKKHSRLPIRMVIGYRSFRDRLWATFIFAAKSFAVSGGPCRATTVQNCRRRTPSTSPSSRNCIRRHRDGLQRSKNHSWDRRKDKRPARRDMSEEKEALLS